MKENFININRLLEVTEAEGPGKRLCIWVQGCNRRCEGCCNFQMLEIKPVNIISVAEINAIISNSKVKNSIEGITLLGGEPAIQAKGLSEIAAFAQSIELSVITFTGYTLQELQSSDLPGIKALLSNTDVLIDGSFEKNKPDKTRNWIGSTNQRFYYFTDVYKPDIETNPKYRNCIEIRIDDLKVEANGCPFAIEELLSS